MPVFNASIEPSTESQILFAARRRRKSLLLKNDTRHHLLIGLDLKVSAEDFTTKIPPDAEWNGPDGFDGAVTLAVDISKIPVEYAPTRSGLVSGIEVF